MWYQMLFLIYIAYLQCPNKRDQKLEFIFNDQLGDGYPMFIETSKKQFDLSFVFYGIQNV